LAFRDFELAGRLPWLAFFALRWGLAMGLPVSGKNEFDPRGTAGCAGSQLTKLFALLKVARDSERTNREFA
jgi:hypothetical protein